VSLPCLSRPTDSSGVSIIGATKKQTPATTLARKRCTAEKIDE
jgi:hypothetical protein